MSKQASEWTERASIGLVFPQDYGCFACGTASGFRIYNCEPFRETVRTTCSWCLIESHNMYAVLRVSTAADCVSC